MRLCECGCGKPTPIAKRTRSQLGHIKGEPIPFIRGHKHRGKTHYHWKGGKIKNRQGYFLIWQPDHPRADARGYVYEHILIAQNVLGKPLPLKAVVHHINDKKDDNRPENLIICQDQNYHKLIHLRNKSLTACGNVHWRKCNFCKRWDAPENLYISPNNKTVCHRECAKRSKNNVSHLPLPLP